MDKSNRENRKKPSTEDETYCKSIPKLTATMEHEELIIYLAAAKEAINAVLDEDRGGKGKANTNQPIKQADVQDSEISGRMLKWKFS
ncbi:hypothetical protein Tco_0726897 [Tanacetum coccineum]|uniref:Uncharacterized protein n=1 Tax=Tanacetum coccineum TaxID=301880 RepID=A0ABQ4YHU4_9ASTR